MTAPIMYRARLPEGVVGPNPKAYQGRDTTLSDTFHEQGTTMVDWCRKAEVGYGVPVWDVSVRGPVPAKVLHAWRVRCQYVSRQIGRHVRIRYHHDSECLCVAVIGDGRRRRTKY